MSEARLSIMAQKITFNHAKQKNKELHGVDVVILCGGLGTRLRSVVVGKPKALAPVGHTPFSDILIESLLSHGFSRIILAVGHLKEDIKDHYRSARFSKYAFPEIIFSEEHTPLGTGGALKNALRFVKSDQFLVTNGDCVCHIDYKDFYAMHTKNDSLLSIALAKMDDISDYGQVVLNQKGHITEFKEKSPEKVAGLVSAGTYLMNKRVLSHMPEVDVFSLERDLFPRLVGKTCRGFIARGEVLDIGVPERYQKAVEIFNDDKSSFLAQL